MPTPEPAKPITEEVKPKELPKTASPMELVGLIGLASTASAGFLARGRRG
jgi:LPXTG-motif cell wall-anchored protein